MRIDSQKRNEKNFFNSHKDQVETSSLVRAASNNTKTVNPPHIHMYIWERYWAKVKRKPHSSFSDWKETSCRSLVYFFTRALRSAYIYYFIFFGFKENKVWIFLNRMWIISLNSIREKERKRNLCFLECKACKTHYFESSLRAVLMCSILRKHLIKWFLLRLLWWIFVNFTQVYPVSWFIFENVKIFL